VIIGFGLPNKEAKTLFAYEDIKGEAHAVHANRINAYLVDGGTVILESRTKPISNVPLVQYGSMINDGGHLLLTSQAPSGSPHALHTSQQLLKKRMSAKRGRIAHQQQLSPCAVHTHVHAADVRQKADLALGVAASQGDGNDVALLALKRFDAAQAVPALQRQTQPQSNIFHTDVWFFLWLNSRMNHDRSSIRMG